jgi:hypothetical protein
MAAVGLGQGEVSHSPKEQKVYNGNIRLIESLVDHLDAFAAI